MPEALGGNAIEMVRNYVRRAERPNEEIATLNADKAELFGEAKGNGLNVKALKAIISERAKRAKDAAGFKELESDIELYRAALDGPYGEPHAHVREGEGT